MSQAGKIGNGKGGKGLGKGGAAAVSLRNKAQPNKDSLHGLTKPALQRLARRAGVKRTYSSVYGEARNAMHAFLQRILQDTTTYMAHCHRKTVTTMDVIYALKRHDALVYGVRNF